MIKKLFAKLLAQKTITSINLIILTAIFWIAFANFSFFTALFATYPLELENIPFLLVLLFGFTGVLVIVLSLFCYPRTIKPLLIFLLISTSFSAYFMDTYNILIDDFMIKNTFETDVREASDLASSTMFIYFVLLGLLPSIFVYRAKIQFQPFRKELKLRLKLNGFILGVLLVCFLIFGANTSSFFREHKHIRYYSNPANYVFGFGRYVHKTLRGADKPIAILARDAYIKPNKNKKLIIMVVGEAARADRFSLNGYAKPTNPELAKQDIISFSKFRSCGTLTAISVPCMFSIQKEDGFDVEKARRSENAVDVLNHAGVKVLWRDNNSSSKNVADRVTYEDYKTPATNTICDEECRDEGMLVGLQEFIDTNAKGDILIVLHQMGNHGPAYYKRYPKAFEKFTPTCKTNELSDCTDEEIGNAYDNAILYTDHVLNQTIELLKKNDDRFETAMFYVSDHGESLGENGLYLHGLPNFIAPETQRHIPAILWVGKNFDEIDMNAVKAKRNKPLNHDSVFHILLGLFEVEHKVYDKSLDFIKN